jgi:hypothetical protein
LGLFSFFWNRGDGGKKDFERSVVTNEQIADAQRGTDPNEYAEQLTRANAFTHDDRIDDFFKRHPEYAAFIPAFSPVNRTTKHISKQDAKIAWLDNQILFTMTEMTMSPDDYENGAMEIIQGFEIYGNTQISDGFDGFKAKVLTEQRKVITAQEVKK